MNDFCTELFGSERSELRLFQSVMKEIQDRLRVEWLNVMDMGPGMGAPMEDDLRF